MIIPIRCMSCGKVIGDKWDSYLELLQRDYTEGYFHLNTAMQWINLDLSDTVAEEWS